MPREILAANFLSRLRRSRARASASRAAWRRERTPEIHQRSRRRMRITQIHERNTIINANPIKSNAPPTDCAAPLRRSTYHPPILKRRKPQPPKPSHAATGIHDTQQK